MNKMLLTAVELDVSFKPKTEWLTSEQLLGLLFLNVPSKDEFKILIDRLGSRLLLIAVGHAEFGKPLSRGVFDNSDEAYASIFAFIHENLFVEIVYEDFHFFLWIPEEHDFYALFGTCDGMSRVFTAQSVKSIRDDFNDYIANDIFNDRAKKHLLDVQRKYMTFEKI